MPPLNVTVLLLRELAVPESAVAAPEETVPPAPALPPLPPAPPVEPALPLLYEPAEMTALPAPPLPPVLPPAVLPPVEAEEVVVLKTAPEFVFEIVIELLLTDAKAGAAAKSVTAAIAAAA